MNTREKIKGACIDLFVQYGLEGTSTKMILDQSGVSNGSLFNHFPNKEQILKEIYLDIKKEQQVDFKDSLDLDKPTRAFLYNFWRIYINWHLNNKNKSVFLEMYSDSAIIKNLHEDSTIHLFDFIIKRIDKALEEEEIVSYNTTYFLLYFMNTARAVKIFLQSNTIEDKESFIHHEFNQYWRSIAKF